MAGNMKAVKLRMKSIENTMQITRVMELVASSRLRKAKERADQSRPYFTVLHDTLKTIARENREFSSPYIKAGENPAWCYVVIAGDRGLAGGYNSNLFKTLEQTAAGKDYQVLPIGKKAAEYFRRRRIPLVTEAFSLAAEISVSDCFEMARLLCNAWKEGSFGHIGLCYTNFISMLSQQPAVSSLLPLDDFKNGQETVPSGKPRSLILYEPDSETVFDAIVPEYLAGLLYGAMCESAASELAARRMAMDTATKNAEKMTEQLSLYYNQARQAGITQEITEIVAGTGDE